MANGTGHFVDARDCDCLTCSLKNLPCPQGENVCRLGCFICKIEMEDIHNCPNKKEG